MASKFARLVKRVLETQDEEIDCSACLDGVSEYVDLELSCGQAAERMPHLKHHLDQCQICQEEYLLLLALAKTDLQGDR